MALKAYGKRAIQAFVDHGVNFRHETIQGRSRARGTFAEGVGRLPEPWKTQFMELHKIDGLRRVLYSYKTPIAWQTMGGVWIVPDAKYTVTTSNHQAVVRVAIDNYSFYKDVKY